MAAVVVGNAVRKVGTDIRDAQLLDEKLAEFKRPRRQIEGGCFVGRAGEQLRIEDPHHRHAGAARAHHRLGIGKDLQRVDGHGAGLVPVA